MKILDISHTRWKRTFFFIIGHDGQVEIAYCKVFQQTEASPSNEHALVFLRWEKILLGSHGELTEQQSICSIFTRCTDYDEIKNPIHIMIIWVVTSDGDVIPQFPHDLRLNPEANIKNLYNYYILYYLHWCISDWRLGQVSIYNIKSMWNANSLIHGLNSGHAVYLLRC